MAQGSCAHVVKHMACAKHADMPASARLPMPHEQQARVDNGHIVCSPHLRWLRLCRACIRHGGRHGPLLLCCRSPHPHRRALAAPDHWGRRPQPACGDQPAGCKPLHQTAQLETRCPLARTSASGWPRSRLKLALKTSYILADKNGIEGADWRQADLWRGFWAQTLISVAAISHPVDCTCASNGAALSRFT